MAVVDKVFGPFDDRPTHGVAHDGKHLWIAAGGQLRALDTKRGEIVRTLPVEADAGTAFDGTHLYQLTGASIQKIDAQTGEVLSTIPSPGAGRDSGMTWAEGSLWVGEYRERKIHRIDPDTGEILKTLESDRFVTGVTWTDGALWHATGEDATSQIRRIDVESGEVLECLEMPPSVGVAGLSSDDEHFLCASGSEGRVRAVKRPKPRARQ